MTGKSSWEIGREKESLAAEYLEKRLGFRIAERNYRCRKGEVDIVAYEGTTLVFIEVRYRREGALVEAIESVDGRKAARIKFAVRHYLATHPASGGVNAEIRVDLCVVSDGASPVALVRGVIEF